MTRRPARCSAGPALTVGHTVRPSGTGAFGEHVWAGRSCTLGCEPGLVVAVLVAALMAGAMQDSKRLSDVIA
jgi:hypothetical protein